MQIGSNRVTQCHYLDNFAGKDMILSLKNLHFETYGCKVNTKFSFFEIRRFNLMRQVDGRV